MYWRNTKIKASVKWYEPNSDGYFPPDTEQFKIPISEDAVVTDDVMMMMMIMMMTCFDLTQ